MIETVATTASTNADLIARARAGNAPPEGFWLRAETQTGGRGRHGREWLSPPGNLYASTVVDLTASDPPAPTLSMVAGLAVHSVIAAAAPGAAIMLKWPNDVLADDGKIAGILAEREGDRAFIGIGINVASAPDLPDRKTNALCTIANDDCPDAETLLQALATAMREELAAWRTRGLHDLLARWTAAAHPPGTRLSVTGSDGAATSGTFAGLDDGGALRLRLANGTERVIHAGEVAMMGT